LLGLLELLLLQHPVDAEGGIVHSESFTLRFRLVLFGDELLDLVEGVLGRDLAVLEGGAYGVDAFDDGAQRGLRHDVNLGLGAHVPEQVEHAAGVRLGIGPEGLERLFVVLDRLGGAG